MCFLWSLVITLIKQVKVDQYMYILNVWWIAFQPFVLKQNRQTCERTPFMKWSRKFCFFFHYISSVPLNQAYDWLLISRNKCACVKCHVVCSVRTFDCLILYVLKVYSTSVIAFLVLKADFQKLLSQFVVEFYTCFTS